MRMDYMYFLIQENYNVLKEVRTSERGNEYEVRNWNPVLKAYESIITIPYFKADVESIFTTQADMKRPKETEIMSRVTASEYLQKHKQLLTKMKSIIEFCDAAGFDISEHGFDVKMPVTNDFSEFAKHIKDLNFVLTQCPYLNIEGERIELKKTDSGTIWLVFTVVSGSLVILHNLAAIVDKCVKIKSHIITVKQQKEMLRAQKLANDQAEKAVGILESLEDMYYADIASELKKEMGGTSDGEENERVVRSLKTLVELMDKGMEIMASVNSPREIKDIFPTSDELKSLPEPQKLITAENEQKSPE